MTSNKKLKDVKPGMENLTLTVRVVNIERPRVVSTRFGDAKTAIALVEDETGVLNLKLWRDQVDLVKTNDVIKIEDGFAVVFGGETEINIGSKGRITILYKVLE